MSSKKTGENVWPKFVVDTFYASSTKTEGGVTKRVFSQQKM